MNSLRCRFCKTLLKHSFADLGVSPLANSYLKKEQLNQMEPFYPLHAYVCESCYLVQLKEFKTPREIFSDYAYFSSYSESWLNHAKEYTEQMVDRFGFDAHCQVVEVGSNDGYLLQYFKEKNIPVLGVEPAMNVAEVAKKKGITTIVDFFGVQAATKLIADGKHADLINGTNVMAQVPNLHDFVRGFKILLKPQGVATIEFPHLMRLMEENQFDTIYHEHFSYFSLFTVNKIFAEHGLTLFDVEELPTFGGSLRIYLRHMEDVSKPISRRISDLLNHEADAGIMKIDTYSSFGEKVKKTKRDILDFMLEAKKSGMSIAGYGAPAKANTLLNYCGIRTDFIDYTVDRNPHKQDHYLPGTRIPIHHPDKVRETKPDYLVILPWNIKEEIMEQMSHVREWGGKFIVLIPRVNVHS